MKLNNINGNMQSPNSPQNFGAVKMSLADANKLLKEGEAHLPTSVRSYIHQLDIDGVIDKFAHNRISNALKNEDAMFNDDELPKIQDTANQVAQGYLDQNVLVESIEQVISDAIPIKLGSITKRISELHQEKYNALPTEDEVLKRLTHHRERLFLEAETGKFNPKNESPLNRQVEQVAEAPITEIADVANTAPVDAAGEFGPTGTKYMWIPEAVNET